jgi:hypothetical protein
MKHISPEFIQDKLISPRRVTLYKYPDGVAVYFEVAFKQEEFSSERFVSLIIFIEKDLLNIKITKLALLNGDSNLELNLNLSDIYNNQAVDVSFSNVETFKILQISAVFFKAFLQTDHLTDSEKVSVRKAAEDIREILIGLREILRLSEELDIDMTQN